MDLDEVAARLRRRNPYEALDLGVALGRRFFGPLLRGWAVCVLPFVVAALVVATTTPFFWLVLLVLWWLKPLFDRAALFVLSRSFFGDVPSVGRVIDYALGSWRTGGALADLTWRRFSFFRGVSMSVRELEQLGGSEGKERIGTLLRRDVLTPAAMLTAVGLMLEFVLVAAAGFLVVMVAPQTIEWRPLESLELLFDDRVRQPVVEAGLIGLYAVAMSLVEIFYVAASFALYINRRIGLEGWDIEIVFRRLARRLEKRARRTINTAAAILLAAGLTLVGVSKPAFAEGETHRVALASWQYDEPPASETPREVDDAQKAAEEIVAHPEFGEETTETRWELREEYEGLFEDDSEEDAAGGEPLAGLGAGLAAVIKIILWIAAIGVVIAAGVYFIGRIRRAERPETSQKTSSEAHVEVEPIASDERPREMTLPDALVEEAVARWEAGAHAESLSYLYRGTIAALSERYDIDLDDSLTARECAEEVARERGPAGYMGELAGVWTSTVYADRPPTEERARELFDGWRRHFGPGGRR